MNFTKLLLCSVLAASLASVAAADSLEIESTGATTVIVPGSGTTTYSNSNFNGWNILITFGSSNAPGLSPYGLDLTAVVTCNGNATCTTNFLDILYSDTNFTVPVAAGNFAEAYSSTGGGSGTGSSTLTAWASSSNTLFAEGAGNQIGSVSLSNSSATAGNDAGGPSVSAPYSLTIDDLFADSTGTVSFSTDADVTAAPEPSEALMLGSGLLGLLGFVRRKGLNIA